MWALWRGRWAQLYRGYYYWYIDLQLIYRKCIQCWSLLETSKYWNIFLFLQVTQSELAHTNSCCFRKLEVICDIWDILLIIKCCFIIFFYSEIQVVHLRVMHLYNKKGRLNCLHLIYFLTETEIEKMIYPRLIFNLDFTRRKGEYEWYTLWLPLC